MAKGRYAQWITDDGLTIISGWARDGLTDDQIAAKMGIRRQTIYKWINKFPVIGDALKDGKELPDYKVETALYNKALAGDTTAMIFWLKNRRPDKWRDRVAADQPGSGGVVIRIDGGDPAWME